MNRSDILALVSGKNPADADYIPVACLLSSGYACVGYFNSSVNQSLSDTLVLLNMRLVDLRVEENHSRRGRIADFNDFLQDVVFRLVSANANLQSHDEPQEGTIPLTAVPVREIALLYPVAHIATLLQSARKVSSSESDLDTDHVPTFLDFNNKSIVLKVLRKKLW